MSLSGKSNRGAPTALLARMMTVTSIADFDRTMHSLEAISTKVDEVDKKTDQILDAVGK